MHDIRLGRERDSSPGSGGRQEPSASGAEILEPAVLMLDDQYHFTYLNDQAAQVLKRSRETLLSRSLWESYPEMVGSRFYRELCRSLSEQRAVQFIEFFPACNRSLEICATPSPAGLLLFMCDAARNRSEDGGRSDPSGGRQTEQNPGLQAQILAHIHDAVVATDLKERVTYWNRGAERMFGYPAEEALGRHVSFVFLENERTFRRRLVIGPLRKKGFHEVEVQLRRKSGQRFFAQLSLSFLKDDRDLPIGIIGCSVDITSYKEAEDHLQAQARRQAGLAELGQIALAGMAPADLKNHAVRLLANTLQVEFATLLKFFPRENKLFLEAGVGWREGTVGKMRVFAGLESQAGYTLACSEPVITEELSNETRFQPPPTLLAEGALSGASVSVWGEERPYGVLSVHSTRARNFSSDDIHFLQSVANVLAAAFERQRMEDKFHRLLESAPDAVVILNPEGEIHLLNARAEKLFGWSRLEALGRPIDELVPRIRRYKPFFRSVSTPAAADLSFRKPRLEVLLCDRQGRKFPAEITLSPLETEEGFLLSAYIRDVSERREAEIMRQKLALIQQNRADMLAVLNQLSVGAAMTDEHGKITFLSNLARHLLSLEAGEVAGKPWEVLFGDGQKELEQLRETVKLPQKLRTRVPMKIDLPSGRTVRVEVEVQDKPWSPKRRVFLFHDVTELHVLRGLLHERTQFKDLVGKSAAMGEVFQHIVEVSAVDSTVLIEGETGTGKELVARAIHQNSQRRKGPFVAVNCAAIPETLIESQLFGHKRGAFTGANEDRKGVFEEAHGGTIFLDEIGDLSPSAQTRLLRVLQEREVLRVGETRPRKIDVRVLAATQNDLDREVAEGRFRSDLLYRVKVARVRLPALRERREDIPSLVGVFLQQVRASTSKSVEDVSEEAMRLLMEYDWPGNVRELRNAIEYAVIVCKGSILQKEDLPAEVAAASARLSPEAPSAQPRGPKEILMEALRKAGGNRALAARLLGVSRQTIYRRMARYGVTNLRESSLSPFEL